MKKEFCAVCKVEWRLDHMRQLEDGDYCPFCYLDYRLEFMRKRLVQ